MKTTPDNDTEDTMPTARRDGDRIVLPGFATAHSHAFQRALRGRTQRLDDGAVSFWSWRALMYDVAEKLDPDTIFAISRFAYAELALSGVTAVGEFHYLHHGPSGAPYDDRIAMSDAVVRAAREVGLRVTLLRVVYMRAGWGRAAEGAQRRFCDTRLEDAFVDVEEITQRFSADPHVAVAIAPHSVRAVTRDGLLQTSLFARSLELPLHMHVAEQRREVRECLAEHGLRPVELLDRVDLLDEQFVAVHATHLGDGEAELFGRACSFVCVCRTTERDLGDGSPNIANLRSSGVRLCTGVDSHASSDPFEEARAVELDERTRAEARHVAADGNALLDCASREGYAALGLGDAWKEDRVELDASDASLLGASDEALADAVVFGASPRAVRRVTVAGNDIVKDARLPHYEEYRNAYERALKKLGL